MPGDLDKTDFLFALIVMIVSIYLVGLINEKECEMTATEISKRCDLPIDVKNFRIEDEKLLDANDLLDMENTWLAFRARLTIKDNKLSMEMVRLHSSKNNTSNWRMDPDAATSGGQWFTLKGRWLGKPLSFEFDQRDFVVKSDTVHETTVRKAAKPWFNFKARWLGKKVLKQIDFDDVHERTATEVVAPAVQALPPEVNSDNNEFKRTEGTAVSQDDLVRDVKVTKMSRQDATEMLALETLLPEAKSDNIEIKRTEGTALSQNDFVRDEEVAKTAKHDATADALALKTLLAESKHEMAGGEHTQAIAIPQAVARSLEKEEIGRNISSEELLCELRQKGNASEKELPFSQDSFDASISKEKLQEATLRRNGPTAPSRTNTELRRAMGRCLRFKYEHNASHVVKNTSVCLVRPEETSTFLQTPRSSSDQPSLKQCPLVRPLNATDYNNDASSDGISLGLRQTFEQQNYDRGTEVLDSYCAWYSPTHVLIGAATVATVTAAVATSYVMMARPQYFGAQ